MLGINGWEFLILIVLAVVILGLSDCRSAAKLACGCASSGDGGGAKVTLKDQLGPEYQDINAGGSTTPVEYDPAGSCGRHWPSRSTMCRSRSRRLADEARTVRDDGQCQRTRPVRCSRITGRRQLPRGGRRCGTGSAVMGTVGSMVPSDVRLLGRRGHLKTQLLHGAEVGVSGRRGEAEERPARPRAREAYDPERSRAGPRQQGSRAGWHHGHALSGTDPQRGVEQDLAETVRPRHRWSG